MPSQALLGNHTSNVILECINQVLGNLVRITQTYVDDGDQWSGILAAAEFANSLNNKCV